MIRWNNSFKNGAIFLFAINVAKTLERSSLQKSLLSPLPPPFRVPRTFNDINVNANAITLCTKSMVNYQGMMIWWLLPGYCYWISLGGSMRDLLWWNYDCHNNSSLQSKHKYVYDPSMRPDRLSSNFHPIRSLPPFFPPSLPLLSPPPK